MIFSLYIVMLGSVSLLIGARRGAKQEYQRIYGTPIAGLQGNAEQQDEFGRGVVLFLKTAVCSVGLNPVLMGIGFILALAHTGLVNLLRSRKDSLNKPRQKIQEGICGTF